MNSATLQLVGCNHNACSVELREQLAISSSQLPDALTRFRERFPRNEVVLLSTCNRTELYTAGEPAASHHELAGFLAELGGVDPVAVQQRLFFANGAEVIRHLFTVAASLDSMIVGETQISRQVKDAYRAATEKDSAGQLTHMAFQAALRVAKRVARETALHENRVSVASVAVRDFACRIFDDLSRKSVLVIGAGETAAETVRSLIEEGATEITIINRSRKRAEQMASEFQARDRGWEELDSLMVDADLVVSATGANDRIVTRERFDGVSKSRHQRPMMILDLAIPRDFEPSIGDCLGVYLYTVDDLRKVCDIHLKQRERELPLAKQIIEQETQRFMIDLELDSAKETIKQLKTNAQVIQDSELERLLNKLPDLDAQQRDAIERSFSRLTNKLLHPPLESLRQEPSGDSGLLVALRRLFQIKE